MCVCTYVCIFMCGCVGTWCGGVGVCVGVRVRVCPSACACVCNVWLCQISWYERKLICRGVHTQPTHPLTHPHTQVDLKTITAFDFQVHGAQDGDLPVDPYATLALELTQPPTILPLQTLVRSMSFTGRQGVRLFSLSLSLYVVCSLTLCVCWCLSMCVHM